jgi:hypothetical protein
VFVLVKNLNTILLKLPTLRFFIDLEIVGLKISHVLDFALFNDADINVRT